MISKAFETLPRVSGSLCLDFANTIERGGNESGVEWFESYEDIVAWAASTPSYNQDDVSLYLSLSESDRNAAFLEALKLRQAIRAVFTAIANKETPHKDSLDFLNKKISLLFSRASFDVSNGEVLFCIPKGGKPEDILNPIIVSSAKTLERSRNLLIKKCSRDDCTWVFIDTTKNKKRRWCEMAVCGNRTKNKRFISKASR